MAQGSLPNRLSVFTRSVIPQDPTQMLFLAGVVCVVVAPRMGWSPSQPIIAHRYPHQWPSPQAYSATRPIVALALFSITFSGMAGYFVSFWPGVRPVRRVFWTVCLPLIIGLAVIFGNLLYVTRPSTSIFDANNGIQLTIGLARSALWTLPPGFQFALLGFFLIAIFFSRLAFGIASLPLALEGEYVTKSNESGLWQRIQILTWILEGPLFFVVGLPLIILFIPLFTSQPPRYFQSVWFYRLADVVGGLVFMGITLWIVGKRGQQILASSVRPPRMKYLILALSFPVGIGLLISTGQYLRERALWAETDLGRAMPPQFGSYFTLPSPWLLLMVVPVLAEEIAFRGLLQPTFIRRYGLQRGIFLTGVVWAASHFRSDISSTFTPERSLFQLGFRVFMCLALGFVLAWLTLQSGSILPAVVAHTFYNVFVLGSFGLPFVRKETLRVFLWGALALLLFSYWPIQAKDQPENADVTTTLA